jgi:hypothetical protein
VELEVWWIYRWNYRLVGATGLVELKVELQVRWSYRWSYRSGGGTFEGELQVGWNYRIGRAIG